MGEKLRYGFKAQSERLAVELRSALGVTVYDRLDPFVLARQLQVPVLSLRAMLESGLGEADLSALQNPVARFSALTVCYKLRRLIVFNDGHSPERTANDVTHELSHVILEHPPRPTLSFGGCRQWDEIYEGEASWQSGALLVPRDGAFHRLRCGDTLQAAAAHFGVTEDLFRWRANRTGVLRVLGQLRAS